MKKPSSTLTREIKALRSRLKKHEAEVSKARNHLRDTIAEFEALFESCNTAMEHLESAADTLSELV